MRKIYLMLLYILLSSCLFAQDLSQFEKENLINGLDSSDVLGYILPIIDYHVVEALPKIEERIWELKNRNTQIIFLKAMLELESNNVHQYALDFLDTLMNSPDPYNSPSFDIINARFDITDILIKLGDYSTAKYVFDYIDYQDQMTDPQALILLSIILKNVPEYQEKAKQELIKVAENTEQTNELYADFRLFAMKSLFDSYGLELLSYIKERYWLDPNENVRSRLFYFILSSNLTESELRKFILNEPNPTIKYSIIRKLSNKFPCPNNLQFISDYANSYSGDKTYERLFNYEVESFYVPEPDSTVRISNMLDTLTSYTNQCYSYEWLKDEAYKTELLNKITNAKTKLNTGDSLGYRTEVASFQNSVNQVYQDSAGSYPKYVSNEGYKFLYYYAQYILDRLPEHAKIHSPNTTKEHYHTN